MNKTILKIYHIYEGVMECKASVLFLIKKLTRRLNETALNHL
jgi:hypothetical protein